MSQPPDGLPAGKEDVSYVDIAGGEFGDKSALRAGLVKSRFDNLSVTQALWTFRRAFMYTLMLYTAYIMDGYEVTMSGSIIANQGFIRQFGELQSDGTYAINSLWVSAWGAIINVGQIISMSHIGWIADRYGRLKALYVGWAYALLCLIFMTVARVPAVWLIAKLLVGMAVGISQVIVTPFVMEIAPTRCRGAMIAVGLVWQQIGGITCSVMMDILNQNHPTKWLLPVYIEYAMIGIMFFCYIFVPETPWYYGRRGDAEGAMKSMRRLYGNIPDYNYEEEYGIISRTIAHEKEMDARANAQPWSQIFRGLNGKRTFILVVMCTGQQVGGNALIAVYSTYFFQQAGLANPFSATMIQTCVALVAIIIYVGIIDRIGRRLPICITYTVLTAVLFIIGGLFYNKSQATQRVLLALVCIWQPCFTLFANSYQLIAAELPSLELRQTVRTVTFVWFYQALWGIVLTRSVAEIDELFERGVPAWRAHNFVTHAETQLNAYIASERGQAV